MEIGEGGGLVVFLRSGLEYITCFVLWSWNSS